MSRSKTDPRLSWATLGMGALLGLTALSQAKVQLFQAGDVLDRAAETSRFSLSRVEYAKRGRILASDGRPLARDEDSHLLRMDFRKVPQSDGFYAELSAASGVPASELRSLALAGVGKREWKRSLSAAESAAVRKVKYAWRSDGLDVGRSGRRSYPLGEAAAGIVGQIKDGTALTGLEKSQDALLSGKDGVTVGLMDRMGSFLPMRIDEDHSYRPKDGQDLQLTIDYDLQRAASEALRKAVEKHKADQGAAIVMDPRTGDVLAMANWPTFDPNAEGGKGAGMAVAKDFNAAYMAQLEPGSTFKPITLAKALDSGAVSDGSRFYCSGGTVIGPKQVRCDLHNGTRAHGQLDLDLAIAKSCNIWASTWSRRVGHDQFVGYLEDMGLMERPGLGLPDERGGNFNYDDYSKTLQLGILGFGQAINVTPIALCTAFASLANDGKVMIPRLIHRIGSKEMPVREASQPITAASALKTMRAMEAVIESDVGTGKTLRIPGYRLAGKTGTAQRINAATGSKGGGGYVANFVGYVPAQNPRAVILVMVDRPKSGGYYGAIVAGPAFVDIAKAVIRRYSIPPGANEGTKAPARVASAQAIGSTLGRG